MSIRWISLTVTHLCSRSSRDFPRQVNWRLRKIDFFRLRRHRRCASRLNRCLHQQRHELQRRRRQLFHRHPNIVGNSFMALESSLLFTIRNTTDVISVNSKVSQGLCVSLFLSLIDLNVRRWFSSTLLQHLFTHVFFCQHCAFYTYSHYQLSQHMFEKHELNLIEDISDPLDPKAFDLLYLTRCADGTFALCMDAAAPSSSKYSHDQQLILSSTTLNDQPLLKATKKSSTKEDRNELVVSEEKRDTTAKPSSSERSRVKEKSNRNYLVMKHRRFYSLKRSPALHSITLEYNICRERMIRHMARTQDIIKRRANQAKSDERRLIDEISHCLRTTVNQIVDSEENRLEQKSLSKEKMCLDHVVVRIHLWSVHCRTRRSVPSSRSTISLL